MDLVLLESLDAFGAVLIGVKVIPLGCLKD